MCLIAIAWQTDDRYPLALIANRDEAHARPTAPAARDASHPDVYGGRDLQAGGSWLLVSARGRLAAVTNVRDGLRPEAAPRSRGALVSSFAEGSDAADAFAAALAPHAHEYGRFNLLLWDGEALVFAGNHPRFATHAVEPGVHAMSNGAFDAPWPKATHATQALSSWLSRDRDAAPSNANAMLAPLFDALADTTQAPDALLPDTGVGLELERALSPPFVRGAAYGTRCSSVVLVGPRRIVFAERRFGPGGAASGEGRFDIDRVASPTA
jgi:uncharacterized protein with NRDE domain